MLAGEGRETAWPQGLGKVIDRRSIRHHEITHQLPDFNSMIVSESLLPGATVNGFAERHGLKANHLLSCLTLARQAAQN